MKLVSTISVVIFAFALISNQLQEVSAKSASSSGLQDEADVTTSNLRQERDVKLSEHTDSLEQLPVASNGSKVKRSGTTSVRGDLVGQNNKVQAVKPKSTARARQSIKNKEKVEKFEIIKKRMIITINNLMTHAARIVDQIVEGESKAEFLELKELVDQLAADFIELSPLLDAEFIDGSVVILRDLIGKLLKPLIEIDIAVEPYEGKIVDFLKRFVPGAKSILPLASRIIPSIQGSFNKAFGSEYPASASVPAPASAQ